MTVIVCIIVGVRVLVIVTVTVIVTFTVRFIAIGIVSVIVIANAYFNSLTMTDQILELKENKRLTSGTFFITIGS